MKNQAYNTEEFRDYLLNIGCSDSTINSYTYSLESFLSAVDSPVGYCYNDIIHYFDSLKHKNYAKRTKASILAVIKKFYDYLIEKGIRDTHPCRRLVIKGKDSRDVIHHELFTPVELEQLLHREEKYPSLKIRNQVIISLLIYQGLTISEIEKLKLYHIDLDTGMINVPRSKTISKRTLPMQSSQQLLFYRYLHEVRPKQEVESQDAFILNKLGDPLQKQPIKSLIKSLKYLFPNKNLNPTSIRKSVIANWLNIQKLPLDQVQLMSGQKWATSTEKYKYNDEDEEREMINRFFPI